MPILKSAKKRVLINAKKRMLNKIVLTKIKNIIKNTTTLINNNKYEEANTSLQKAYKIIDMAVSKHVIHKNKAANKKSKLALKLNKIKK